MKNHKLQPGAVFGIVEDATIADIIRSRRLRSGSSWPPTGPCLRLIASYDHLKPRILERLRTAERIAPRQGSTQLSGGLGPKQGHRLSRPNYHAHIDRDEDGPLG